MEHCWKFALDEKKIIREQLTPIYRSVHVTVQFVINQEVNFPKPRNTWTEKYGQCTKQAMRMVSTYRLSSYSYYFLPTSFPESWNCPSGRSFFWNVLPYTLRLITYIYFLEKTYKDAWLSFTYVQSSTDSKYTRHNSTCNLSYSLMSGRRLYYCQIFLHYHG